MSLSLSLSCTITITIYYCYYHYLVVVVTVVSTIKIPILVIITIIIPIIITIPIKRILLLIFRKTTSNYDEKTLTVVFHAILSDKFKFDGEMRILIRGDEPVFGGWNKGGIPVKTEK